MGISISRIVNILSKLGSEFTIDDLISRFNLAPSTARRYLYYMLKNGIIYRNNGKYKLTDYGKSLIESIDAARREVSEEYSYVFTDLSGSPIILKINSIEKLYGVIKYRLIPVEIIQYHIERGYLTTWISEQVGAKTLATRLREQRNIYEVLKILEEYLK
ncbi:MAG: winged helix-turn-helix domain-containing protein [Desulfurococcaceae archaeon]